MRASGEGMSTCELVVGIVGGGNLTKQWQPVRREQARKGQHSKQGTSKDMTAHTGRTCSIDTEVFLGGHFPPEDILHRGKTLQCIGVGMQRRINQESCFWQYFFKCNFVKSNFM